MEKEGRVGVIGDPSFSQVVWKLFKEAGQAVARGGRSAPFVVRGAICGSGRRRWGAVQLESQNHIYCLLFLLVEGTVKRNRG
jgi:hypothetical protein